jgi:alanine dehydrogenase
MSSGKLSGFSDIAKQAMMQPQESMLEVKNKKNKLFIGIPKETSFQENRVPLTPLSVALLINNGHDVMLESNAGLAAKFLDKDYGEQGAHIVYDSKQLYEADIIIKIAPPTLAEIELMKPGQVLISALQMATFKADCLQALMNKKVTALCFEHLRDEGGSLCVVRAMSEIVGATSILIAAEYLSNIFGGKGLMLGGITGVPPTEIVILGAGTVGEYAARTAISLGAEVKVFDPSIYKLRRLQNNIGARVFTSVVQPIVLEKAITTCDVAIPCIVSESTVSRMKPNAVIIDVSIDQGGCFETSEVTNHTHPVFRKHEVIHYCVPNIASRVARTATYALTNIFAPILLEIGEHGNLKNLLWQKAGLREAVYIFKGHLTSKHMGERFSIPTKDIDLLIVSHH